MDDLNGYRCSYVSGILKVFFFFKGNMKDISLVWSQ